ncbi:carotenoid biosynthesis protein [Algoriphagus aquatilis]|uniref:Carotenoid biosynthesis protein n=2 Tax=Bacteroidota TaxID=976 RepID=A0ABW0BV23_9BACT|nr:carotenoid biosynthesis protein [Algoriphagus sp.]
MHKFNPERGKSKLSKELIGKIILVALHVVGVIGLSLPEYQELFLMLTPAHLLTTMVLMLLYHKGWNDAFPIFAAAAFWIGFGSEIIGIHTGYLYGDYVYGPTLGPKLWDVPLVIGVNWFILAYLTGSVFHKIPNDWYAAFLGATAMTALDYILEPVAVALEFWAWKWETIPVSNYLGWFGVSFLVHLIYRKANFEKSNPIAVFLLITWILFFTILNFTLIG